MNLTCDYNYRIIRLDEITKAQRVLWNSFRERNLQFQTPFLSLGYLELCDRVGSDVRVCIINSASGVVGFFPVELHSQVAARPVGSIFNDYQAVIGRTGLTFDIQQLLKDNELESLHLDHMLQAKMFLPNAILKNDVSWIVDLGHGYKAYSNDLNPSQRRHTARINRQKRRIENQFGKVCFKSNFESDEMLQLLMDWKSRQWAQSGWSGRFKADWEKTLMYDLMRQSSRDFQGVFSGLFLRDEPLALHLGLASSSTWHYWTTAYNKNYEKFSPGLIMLDEMLKAADSLGFKLLDLGKGDLRYKREVSNIQWLISEAEMVLHT